MNSNKSRLALWGVMGFGLALLARQAKRQRRRLDFRGKTIVITGGRGLALVLARDLADQGARIALLARDPAELERAERDLLARGAEVMTLTCDVGEQAQVEQALSQVVERFGSLDVLFNVAGVIQVGPIEHMVLADYAQAMDVHFWGALYTMLEAIPYMRQQGGGRIVNITSIGGEVAVPHLAPYVASKFAVVGLSDSFRTELSKDKIRVTTVVPGLMRTGSYVNAFFKGNHRREYLWFSLMAALPFFSTDAPGAAREIISACRFGESHKTITFQARWLALANTLFPGLTAFGMKIFNRLLPKFNPQEGYIARTGWESQSGLSPSPLTYLGDVAAERNNELAGHSPIVE